MELEPTLQQRAPLDAGESPRLFALGGGCLAVSAAIAMTAQHPDQVTGWPFEVAAIVVLALAGVAATFATSSFRAPFRMRSHLLVLVLAVAAFLLDELAQLGTNTVIHDDWGLVAIPIFLFVVAQVRPAREVLLGGLAATAVVGWTAVLVSPFLVVQVGPFARASVAMTSILAPACAAAAFTGAALRRLGARRTTAAGISPIPQAVRLSVQQESIARLEAEVVPLLNDVIAAGTLTEDDSRRARALATGLRVALVSELNRDWLSEAGFRVSDPQGYADRLSARQRTAIRSALAALPLLDPERPGTAKIIGQDLDGVLELAVPVQRRPPRALLAPVIMVLRTRFTRAEMRVDEHAAVLVLDFRIGG
ncbi:MAG: hypothetical protein QOC59_70 [Microbacteriaceae bacterium]|jgi:hypothetical protein|nr:hypothetical protein [Microbacteriaceae bacterium]